FSGVLHGLAYGINTVDLMAVRRFFSRQKVVPVTGGPKTFRIPIGQIAFGIDMLSMLGGAFELELPDTGDLFFSLFHSLREAWNRLVSGGTMDTENFRINEIENALGLATGPESCTELGIQAVNSSNRSAMQNVTRPCQIIRAYMAGLTKSAEDITAFRKTDGTNLEKRAAIVADFQNNEKVLRSSIENLSLAMLQTIYVVQLRRFNHPSAAQGWTTDYYYRVMRNLNEKINSLRKAGRYSAIQAELATYTAVVQSKSGMNVPAPGEPSAAK
ncbi:MAG: hypothetical protein K2X47_04530, partial [Bdellovibrionales bacterium]|nr:hypothetical protein [Bdellovibrionales bacterium]